MRLRRTGSGIAFRHPMKNEASADGALIWQIDQYADQFE
jgi:hypothetical protein